MAHLGRKWTGRARASRFLKRIFIRESWSSHGLFTSVIDAYNIWQLVFNTENPWMVGGFNPVWNICSVHGVIVPCRMEKTCCAPVVSIWVGFKTHPIKLIFFTHLHNPVMFTNTIQQTISQRRARPGHVSRAETPSRDAKWFLLSSCVLFKDP